MTIEQIPSANRGSAHSADAPRIGVRGTNMHQLCISPLLHVAVQLDPSVWLSTCEVRFNMCLMSGKDRAPCVQVDSGPSVT